MAWLQRLLHWLRRRPADARVGPPPPPGGTRPVALPMPHAKALREQIRERGRHVTYNKEVVRSKPELRIANFLYRKGVRYVYEMPIEGATPDFYLPDSNILIEHWGMEKPRYKRRRMEKTKLYRARGYVVVETDKSDVPRLERVLEKRLLKADPHVFERSGKK